MASEKYEFKAKNKVISTRLNDHFSVTEPVEVTVNASTMFNSQALQRKVLSEVSDTFARVWETQSEGSDGFAQFGKVPSEASDASARVWKMLSEASDASARFGKEPSEASDASARVWKVLSEVSDAFARFCKVLSEASDGFARFWKEPSEASDASARVWSMPSEGFDGFALVWKVPSEASTFAALTTEFLACAANQRFAITARIFVRFAAENRKNSRTFGAKDNIVRDFYKKHLRVYLLA